MMRLIFALLFASVMLSCSSGSDDQTKIFEALQKLEANELLVDIEIEGKKFYPLDLPFDGTVAVSDVSVFLNLRNPEGGNVVISIEDQNWFNSERKKIEFEDSLPISGQLQGSFLIGKRKGNAGEGYLLKEGFFEIVQFNQEACIVSVHGILRDPFNETITKPINGFIVWKKPERLSRTEELGKYLFN